ncbi:esterase [Exophiala viscosa]|uniref:esterase n=1 Tax=Exophiala viscosa TaxID=2486360 RepID=UPI002192E32A|nr:esterase [Exophiala viscosa]
MVESLVKNPYHPILPQYLEGMDPVFVEYYNKYHLHAQEVQEVPIDLYRTDPAYALMPPGRSTGPEVAKIKDIKVPVDGGEIYVRVYEPDTASAQGLRPCYINLHGGGWTVGGGRDIDAPFCRLLTAELGCVAFDVDYRLAPEFPYPVPLTDCWTAIQYILEHASEYSIDTTRIAVGGCSAGGHLSAVTSILARDQGTPFVFQLLGCPCIDASATDESGEVKVADDCPYESWRTNAEAPCLPLTSMVWYHNNFLGVPRPQGYKNDWKLSPIKAPSLKGLPPALIVTAEFDVLRDEGEAYAERLRSEGVDVTCVRMKGVPHPFPLFDAVIDAGKEYNRIAVEALRKAFQ